MQEILIPGEGWKLVGEGYKFTEGPATNAKGDVFFNEPVTHKITNTGTTPIHNLIVELREPPAGKPAGSRPE